LKTVPASLHRLTITSWSSFPAAFVVPFPELGVTSHNLIHSAEVRYFSHKRTYPCCQLGVLSRPHFLGVRLGIRTKPITAFFATSQIHPFVSLACPLSMERPVQAFVLTYTIKIDRSEQFICPALYTIDRPTQTTLTILHRLLISLTSPISNGRSLRTIVLTFTNR
jgi:hypothetical protein